MQWSDEQNGSDSEGLFPLSCPLSSYLQLLEVLLLHLLLCYNERLVLNLVYLLRGAVSLNLRHYPGDRRAREPLPQLERESFGVTSSCWLADKPSSRSGSQPASEQPYFAWLDSAKKGGREIQQSGGWWQTSCYSLRLWLNITIDLNKLRQEASGNKLMDNGCRLSYLK